MFINKKAFYTQEGNTMARQFRRVVTGHNPEGKSIILMDGAPPQVLEPMPQLFSHEIWETSAPADNTGQTDTAIRDPRIEPHDPAGTIFRYVEFPPDEDIRDADDADAFAQMGAVMHTILIQMYLECMKLRPQIMPLF